MSFSKNTKLKNRTRRLEQKLSREKSQADLELEVQRRTAELMKEIEQRAQARQEAEERAFEAETLRQAMSAIADTLDPHEMVERVLEHLAQVVPYDSASVQVRRPDNTTEVVGGRGFADMNNRLGIRFPLTPDNLTGQVYQTFTPLVLADVTREFPAFKQPPGMLVRGWICVPLVARGQVIGHLTLDSQTTGRFTERDGRMVMAYADQMALALENAQAFQEARQRAEELGMFYEIGLAITSGLEMDRLLFRVYEQVRRFAPLDAFYIALYDPNNHQVSYPIFEDRGQLLTLDPRKLSDNPGLTGWVIEHRRTLNLTDTLDPPEWLSVEIVRIGGEPTRSYVGVPLLLREQVIGVVSMQSYPPNCYTPDQIRLLETMANQAAIAIENSRLYEQAQQELALRQQAEASLRQANTRLQEQLSEIRSLQASLREQAIRDPLTGLFNRRYLEETLGREIARSGRAQQPLSVIMIDIDHFKNFNDTYGHKAGDKVMAALGKLMLACSRTSDVACRYGGEEFVLILPDTSLAIAQQRAEKLRREFAALEVYCDAEKLHATISLGVAIYPQHGLSAESLLHKADEAMYRAKAAGRNQVCLTT